ncbi:hypothetical protein HFP72_05960 [Nocardiopsis sp. ARC36]
MNQSTNTTSTNPLVRFGRALVDVLRDAGPVDIAARVGLGAGTVGATLWIQQAEEQFWGALLLGIAVSGAIGSVFELLGMAVARMQAPALWYAPGRVVQHLNMGRCRVLDYDDRDELDGTWLLIQPLERGDESALWVEADRGIAATNAELQQRWDGGEI